MKKILSILAFIVPCFLQAQTYVFGVNIGSTGGATPTITRSPSSLSGFSNTVGSPSTGQASSISGTNLTADIVVPATANYEVSLSLASGYTSSSVTLTQSGGIVAATNVYWRLKASAAAGTHTETATITSAGATSVTVSLDGTTSGAATTPDSVKIQMLLTHSNLVAGWYGLEGDPHAAVLGGTIPGTTVTVTTVSTSLNNWMPFASDGFCISANNGVTTATVPDASNKGVMREAFQTANVYDTNYAQVVVSGLKTDGTLYDITLSGATQYAFDAIADYNVKGAAWQTLQSMNCNNNTTTQLTFDGPSHTGIAPDATGTFKFYFGKEFGRQIGQLSFLKIKAHGL